MSRNARQFIAFVGFIVGWSLLANLAVMLKVNPIAIFAVWIVGFVYGVGLILDGSLSAALLLKRWLQMLAGAAILGGTLALFLS